MTYERDELIAICEAAIVPESQWMNRDTSDAQRQIGEAWALLKAGCAYRVDLKTDNETIWLEIMFDGFNTFEGLVDKNADVFYLPTRAKLEAVKGRDWY